MMKQLSVFVENKPGSLMGVTKALKQHDVNIRAISGFDAPEFSILRLIVDDPVKAKDELTKDGFVVRIGNVLGLELTDEKGKLNEVLELLSNHGINLNYIYSFVIRDNQEPLMLLHSDDLEKTEALLKEKGITLVEEP